MIRILNRASQVGNGSVSIRLFSSSNSVKDKYDVVIVGGGNLIILLLLGIILICIVIHRPRWLCSCY